MHGRSSIGISSSKYELTKSVIAIAEDCGLFSTMNCVDLAFTSHFPLSSSPSPPSESPTTSAAPFLWSFQCPTVPWHNNIHARRKRSSGSLVGISSEYGRATVGHQSTFRLGSPTRSNNVYCQAGHKRDTQTAEVFEGLDVEARRQARDLMSKTGMEAAIGIVEEQGAERKRPEESILSREHNIGTKEIRLKGTRGGDVHGASISEHMWEWKHRWHVHYEKAGMENSQAPALLLLPGFGVGSFHYDQQLRDLGKDYRVWAIDFLGQGGSWPSHDPAPSKKSQGEVVEAQIKEPAWGFGSIAEPWAEELVYSVDLWRDQVHAFVQKVIGEPVYVVGNSLGGYVGTHFAATTPGLVKGITLTNATPFWAFMPNPRRYPLLAKFVPWTGLLPVPMYARTVTNIWWNLLRKPQIIRWVLDIVYADRSAWNDKLVHNMLKATDHPAAAAAFASILFAPRAHSDFGENLIRLKDEKISMCMIYGRDDPWVVPFWGQRAKQRYPDSIYYELSPAGHCPHHESPEVFNLLLRKWIESNESLGAVSLALHEAGEPGNTKQWFIIESSKEGEQERKVSVRVKGRQGFLREWFDGFIEIFRKQRVQMTVVSAAEEMSKE